MRLKNLKLENFQGIARAEFDFGGGSAVIYGDNATGKTTVFNAVTWLLFGTASTGATGFTPKTFGKSGELHNMDHAAEAVFLVEDGTSINLRKVFHEVWKKRRGSAVSEYDGNTVDYYIDGVPQKEKQYTEVLQRACGGQVMMRALTMPDYFPEVLPWDERRKILIAMCGDISDKDVIAGSGNRELQEIGRYLRKPGTGDQYYSVEEYRKIAAARKSKINADLKAIPGRIDEAARAIPQGAESPYSAQEISSMEQTLKELTRRRDALLSRDGAQYEAHRKTEEAEAAVKAAKNRYEAEANKANAAVLDDIRKSGEAEQEARKKAMEAREQAQKRLAEYNTMSAARDRLLKEYAEVKATRWDEGREICPTCGQRFTPERAAQMRAEFNQRRSDKLIEINQRGKQSCDKSAVAAALNAAHELEAKAKKHEADAQAWAQRAATLKDRLTTVTPFEATQEAVMLMATVSMCKAEEKEAEENGRKISANIDAKITEIRGKLDEAAQAGAVKRQAETQRARIAELEAEEKRLGQEYEDLERGTWLCEEFTKSKVRMLTEKICSRFKTVRFRLFQEQINGGLKDDCEVLIPGEGGRMVPYSFANNAARINAGLEIIGVLSEQFGLEMPVFVDNAESVTHITQEAPRQIIRLVVSENDKVLRLEAE